MASRIPPTIPSRETGVTIRPCFLPHLIVTDKTASQRTSASADKCSSTGRTGCSANQSAAGCAQPASPEHASLSRIKGHA